MAGHDDDDDEGGSDDDSVEEVVHVGSNHEEDGTSDENDEGGGAHISEDSDSPTVDNEIHDAAVDREDSGAERSRMVDILRGDVVVHVPLVEEDGCDMTHEEEAAHDDDDYTQYPSTDYHPMAPLSLPAGGDDVNWAYWTTAHGGGCWHYSCMSCHHQWDRSRRSLSAVPPTEARCYHHLDDGTVTLLLFDIYITL
jgi:hypothetical protein